jgi:hypothetical protein
MTSDTVQRELNGHLNSALDRATWNLDTIITVLYLSTTFQALMESGGYVSATAELHNPSLKIIEGIMALSESISSATMSPAKTNG